MSIELFRKAHAEGRKISMVTCYDSTFAKIIKKTDVDSVLVGDSAAMTMHGYSSTIPANLEMMIAHVQAVSKGLEGSKFLVADLPFLSFRGSIDQSLNAVRALLQAGAEAVKLEGADGNFAFIENLTQAGIPVMGHLGLTPQFVHQFGGFRVQGKSEAAAKKILSDAIQLEQAGCFSLVLECVPADLAETITKELSIPTIGIGAGAGTTGQVLVLQDLLGLSGFQPKFLRTYLNGAELVEKAMNQFSQDVCEGRFPSTEESY